MSDRYTFDVRIEGGGVRRDVPVTMEAAALRVGDEKVADGSVFWTARRAGLLLLFARERTVAFQGEPDELDALQRRVTARVEPREQRRRLLEPLTEEVVLFAAAAAARGRLGGDPVEGLHVVVATREGLHLFAGDTHREISFPVDEAEVVSDPESHFRDRLVLVDGEDRLELVYLFPEEREQALEAARRPDDGGSLELFSRSEVAPPPPAELPELSTAAGSLQPAARREADEMPPESDRDFLPDHFFEMHFLELGEIALGPLLLRKSAASGAQGLERAAGALDAAELQEDTRAAVARAVSRLDEAYREHLGRLIEDRRAPSALGSDLALTEDERADLTTRAQAPFDKLAPRFRELEEAQTKLLTRLEVLAEGPPDGSDRGVEELAEEWRGALRRVDRGYEEAWGEALEEIRRTWSSTLLPRLSDVASMERRRVPEWVQLVLIALGTALVVGTAALFLLR